MKFSLSDLNPEQKRAALSTEGAMIVLAGAGSGKTKTITYRIAHLIKNKSVNPESILAVTFTNKASNEMKERVASLAGGDTASKVMISTFHSLGVRILKEHIHLMGYRPGFSIYSDSDQAGLLRQISRDIMPGKKIDMHAILSIISRAKNDFVTPQSFKPLSYKENELLTSVLYPRYQSALKGCNAIDFDDIIMLSVNILESNQNVLDKWKNRFRYIMVDEYQDTNQAQYKLVSLLAGKVGNICVVGDDDQSIYGWRGADSGRILSFEKEHRECTVITLERNYRSTPLILKAANAVIANNSCRKTKSLWTEGELSGSIDIIEANHDDHEAKLIVDRIANLRARTAVKYSDISILYRTNSQSRAFEECLRMSDIPYKVVGGQQFFERKEVKDALSYLRVILNPYDEQALLRIVNFPKRGIGDATLIRVNQWALKERKPLFQAYGAADSITEFPAGSAEKLKEFHAILISEKERFKTSGSLAEKTRALFIRIRLFEDIQNSSDDKKTLLKRRDNIEQVINSIAEYEKRDESPTLEGFIEKVSLFDEERTKEKERSEDGVTLMSLHSSKGLEFPVVFLVGMEEDLLPHKNSSNDPKALEEERRLCYVGITRAKNSLTLSRCLKRRKFGTLEEREPSRFLLEIPQELLNTLETAELGAVSEEERKDAAQTTFSRLKELLQK